MALIIAHGGSNLMACVQEASDLAVYRPRLMGLCALSPGGGIRLTSDFALTSTLS